MVDSCDSTAQPEAGRLGDALAYFWHNFGRFYRGNRAPFGVHLHADWLLHNPEYFEAFLRFLKTLLADFDDVYFVTSHQAIEWMKQPRTIDEAHSFLPWKRSCNIGNVTSSQSSASKSASRTNSQPPQVSCSCDNSRTHEFIFIITTLITSFIVSLHAANYLFHRSVARATR